MIKTSVRKKILSIDHFKYDFLSKKYIPVYVLFFVFAMIYSINYYTSSHPEPKKMIYAIILGSFLGKKKI